MCKQSYLILLIHCAVSWHETLALFDENNESSSSLLPHIRQKRMANTSLLGRITDLRVVNLEEPTRVEIVSNGNRIHAGFAIHHFFVITRPKYVQSSFRIKLTLEGRSEEYPEGYSSPFIDIPKDVAVVRVTEPISLLKPERHAIKNKKFTKAAILYALAIVEDYLHYHGVLMQVIGSRWQSEFPSSVLHRRQEGINQNHLIPQSLHVVDIEEPTVVEIITDSEVISAGFAIHNYFVVTRPDYVTGPYRVKLTLEVGSMTTRGQHIYKSADEEVAVIKLQDIITLTRPKRNAFFYHDYSKVDINYAVQIVQQWMQERGYTMRLRAPRREAGAAASGSSSG